MDLPEYALELLLGYDGRVHYFASGHTLRFEVRLIGKSVRTPYGIAYSLTLHTPHGKRLLGFDNAHPVPHRGGRHIKPKAEADHWHRTTNDAGRPYDFVSVEKLLEDFFREAERTLAEQGVSFEIVDEQED
jgi:hypothetical protein